MRQTREEGVEEGFASGLEQGMKQKEKQIAINLMNAGILTEEQICAVTGLDLEELEELKKTLSEE